MVSKNKTQRVVSKKVLSGLSRREFKTMPTVRVIRKVEVVRPGVFRMNTARIKRIFGRVGKNRVDVHEKQRNIQVLITGGKSFLSSIVQKKNSYRVIDRNPKMRMIYSVCETASTTSKGRSVVGKMEIKRIDRNSSKFTKVNRVTYTVKDGVMRRSDNTEFLPPRS